MPKNRILVSCKRTQREAEAEVKKLSRKGWETEITKSSYGTHPFDIYVTKRRK